MLAVPVVLALGCTSAPARDEGLPQRGDTTAAEENEEPVEIEEDAECWDSPSQFSQVRLPDARVGEPYQVDLGAYADPFWGGLSFSLSESIDGLDVGESDPVLSGVPTVAEFVEFEAVGAYAVGENGCSPPADFQEFALLVQPAELGGTDTETGTSTDTDTD